MKPTVHGSWADLAEFSAALRFVCGYCGEKVSTNDGYMTVGSGRTGRSVEAGSFLMFCPTCNAPTLLDNVGQSFPPPLIGRTIEGLNDENIARLYDEARACHTAGSPTGCVSVCRILLMHVGVEVKHRDAPMDAKRKKPGGYQEAIQWLVEAGEITPKQAEWVDHVRDEGNDANHQLDPVSPEDAIRVLKLVETLLVTMYEAPAQIAKARTGA